MFGLPPAGAFQFNNVRQNLIDRDLGPGGDMFRDQQVPRIADVPRMLLLTCDLLDLRTLDPPRYISIPEDQMLRRLRLTLGRKGKLTTRIIKNAPGLPSVACYIKHFGSLRKAYALIGYQGSRDCEWFDVRDHWSDVLSKLAGQVAEALRTDLGIRLNLTDDGAGLARHGNSKIISFQVVRRMARRTPNHVALWRAHLRKEQTKLCVFLRLKEANKVVQDYVLLPAADTAKPYLTLSDGALARHKAIRVDTVNEVLRNIKARFTSSSHAAPAKPARRRPKTKNVRARH